MQIGKRRDPTSHRVLRNPNLPCEVPEDKLLSGPVRKEPRHHLELVELLDSGQVPHLLPNQLLMTERLPAPSEAPVALQERLRVAAVVAEGTPGGRWQVPRRSDDRFRVGKVLVSVSASENGCIR